MLRLIGTILVVVILFYLGLKVLGAGISLIFWGGLLAALGYGAVKLLGNNDTKRIR